MSIFSRKKSGYKEHRHSFRVLNDSLNRSLCTERILDSNPGLVPIDRLLQYIDLRKCMSVQKRRRSKVLEEDVRPLE